jgi:hypothetical protein
VLSQRSDIAGTKKITKLTILKVQEDGLLGPANIINNLIIKVRVDILEEL